MSRKALFVTFEGGEGAGKTTLINSVARQLATQNLYVVKTREPGSTHLGERLRELLLNQASEQPLSPFAELFLFLAARAQHIQEVVRPALEEGKIVLCDRFNDSTIAYQGIARGLGEERVADLCSFVCQGLKPDLTFYLDIDPSVGLMRAKREHPTDRIESEDLDFHRQIREAFLLLAKKERDRIHVLDASQSPEIVCAEALDYVRRRREF